MNFLLISLSILLLTISIVGICRSVRWYIMTVLNRAYYEGVRDGQEGRDDG